MFTTAQFQESYALKRLKNSPLHKIEDSKDSVLPPICTLDESPLMEEFTRVDHSPFGSVYTDGKSLSEE